MAGRIALLSVTNLDAKTEASGPVFAILTVNTRIVCLAMPSACSFARQLVIAGIRLND